MFSLKVCRVCGARATNFNFGAISCEACKSFFRRHVLRNDEIISCQVSEDCIIDKSDRSCSFCRLQKCFAVGMRKDLILSRKKYNKSLKKPNTRNKETPTTIEEGNQIISKTITRIYKNSTDFKEHELLALLEVRNCVSAFTEESTLSVGGEAQNLLDVANFEAYSVKRSVNFCKRFQAFRGLNREDQLILLKHFYIEKSIVRGAFYFDEQNNGFMMVDDKSRNKSVFLKFSLLHELKQVNGYSIVRNFAQSLHAEMENDPSIRDLILAILVFKTRANVSNAEYIRYQHTRYNYLLKRYLEHKYASISKAQTKYHSLMEILSQHDRLNSITRTMMLKITNSEQREKLEKVVLEIHNLKLK